MRIVHLIARLNNGGPVRVIAQLCQAHRRMGHQVLVLTGRCDAGEDDCSHLVAQTGVQMVTLQHLRRRPRPWNDLGALQEITRHLRQWHPDLVHTHTAKAGFLGRLAARFCQLPCLHTYHGHVLHGYWHPLVTRMVAACERLSARYGHCHSLTPYLVHEIAQAHGIGHTRRWHSLPIPVAIPPPSPLDRETIAAQCGWRDYDPALPCLGFLGRMVAVKDPLLFCEVAAAINRQHPIQVFMAGDGPLREAAQQRLRKYDIPHACPGFQDSSLALRLCDVLLMTSRNEGLPLSVIEAAGSGLGVVAAGVGGIRDLPPGPGLRIVSRQRDDLTDACLQMLQDNDAEARQAHGQRLAHICDPQRLAAAYLDMYQRVINSSCS